jgi:hypothetical protein
MLSDYARPASTAGPIRGRSGPRRPADAVGNPAYQRLRRHQASGRGLAQRAPHPFSDAPMRRQFHHHFDLARPRPQFVAAGVCGQTERGGVVLLNQRGKPPDASAPGQVGEAREQGSSEPAALPLVGDGYGNLGQLGVVARADVAGDADQVSARAVDRDDRLVVVVIDVDEVLELGLRQSRLRGEEPAVARLRAEPLEAGGQERLVLGAYRPQDDPAPVAQGDGSPSRRVSPEWRPEAGW